METIEFILTMAAFGAVLFWYVVNVEAGADGARGLLALVAEPETGRLGRRKSYREKPRAARKAAMARDILSIDHASPTYVQKQAAAMRRRFRNQDEARYRVKDKASTYRTKEPDAK